MLSKIYVKNYAHGCKPVSKANSRPRYSPARMMVSQLSAKSLVVGERTD